MIRIGMFFTLATSCLLLCSIASSEAAVSCEDATAATVNGTRLLGTWFEAARNPIGGGSNTEECIQLVIDYENTTVSAILTYSTAPNLWINQTTTRVLQVNQTSEGSETPQVFTAVFYLMMDGANITLKILETDYTSYILSCAYMTPISSVSTTTQATSTSTVSSTASSSSSSSTSSSSTTPVSTTTEVSSSTPAGAFILTRVRQVTSTALSILKQNALSKFSDFANLSNVTQSDECYKNGTATTMPLLAMVMTMLYALLKIVY